MIYDYYCFTNATKFYSKNIFLHRMVQLKASSLY